MMPRAAMPLRTSARHRPVIPELQRAGKFVTREFVGPLQGPPPTDRSEMLGIRRLFYARPSEAWRIDAYIMMITAAAKAGWSEGLERLEGSLLGYEEWQTDLELERLRVSRPCEEFPLAEKVLRGRSAPKLPTQIFVRISYGDSRSAVSH